MLPSPPKVHDVLNKKRIINKISFILAINGCEDRSYVQTKNQSSLLAPFLGWDLVEEGGSIGDGGARRQTSVGRRVKVGLVVGVLAMLGVGI